MLSWHPFLLTLKLMAVTVVLAGTIGVLAAWAVSSVERSGRLGRWVARFFLASMVGAIVMPMILHAAAWEATAGKFGWLPLTQTGSRTTAIGAYGAFSGLLACGWIHGLVGSAIVALATWYGVERVPRAVIDQASLEAGPQRIWWRIRLPIAAPWLVSALVGAAALAATEMTVVNLYGYRTVADEFYLYHSVNASGTSILLTCLLPMVMASLLILQAFVWRRRLLAVTGQRWQTREGQKVLPSLSRAIAAACVVSVALLVVAVPLLGLVVKAGHQVTVDEGERTAMWSLAQCITTVARAPSTFSAEYGWTALIAISTGVLAVLLGWIAAAAGRSRAWLGRGFDAAGVILVLIPGPIVGLGVVRFFQLELPGFRVAYQQTLVPTILALSVRAVPVAYWILRTGYRGIDDRILDAARLDRAWPGRVWSIDRPLLKRSLIAAWLGAAVVASGDVPAMLPVIPPGVTTVGTRLFELLHNGARNQEAALALWYVAAVIAVVAVWLRWGGTSRVKLEC